MKETRRSSEVRQVELTDAALHIIATRGIAAVTTRNLATQVGLSSGAIFRHFPSIDALLEAVVFRVEAVLDATFPPANLPALERLEAFVTARSLAVGGQLGIIRLVLSEQFHLALPSGGSERLAACVRKTRAFIIQCVEDGQRAGSIRVELAPTILAPIIMGTLQMLALGPALDQPAGTETTDGHAVIAGILTLLRPTPAPVQPSPAPHSPITKE